MLPSKLWITLSLSASDTDSFSNDIYVADAIEDFHAKCLRNRGFMSDILNTIAQYTRERVARAKAAVSTETLRQRALAMNCATGFPFEETLAQDGIRFICECKKASPSKGLIAEDFPYVQIAKEYEDAGAACISVLTEPKWFLGQDSYLQEITRAVSIPCIRKDFTIDEYMIYEAKLLGASAVLLICALLDTDTLRRYLSLSDELGLSALVEAHDEAEIASALSAGARIIGINNRNLKNFTVDIGNSGKLRSLVPQEVLFVAESGIKTRADVAALEQAHVDAILIGEALMRAPDKKRMLRKLQGSTDTGSTCTEYACRNEAENE